MLIMFLRTLSLVFLGGGGGGGRVLLGIFGGRKPPGSSNPDPISDQKCHFPDPFSDQASFQTWP